MSLHHNQRIDQLISSAAQCYGSNRASANESLVIDYHKYLGELSNILDTDPTNMYNQIKKTANQHSLHLQTHIHYKYGYGDERKSYACQRDLFAIDWLNNVSHLENNSLKEKLGKKYIKPISISSQIKSKQLTKILSKGIPRTNDEWLEAVCLTNDVNIRDLLRLKFGPEIFPPGFAEEFQLSYSYDLIEFVEDILGIFPELKKYCLEYCDTDNVG